MSRIGYLILILVFTACEKNTMVNPLPQEESVPIDIGEFKLLQESLAQFPYQEDGTIIFIDSLDRALAFQVSVSSLSTRNAKLFRYNVYEEGDIVAYSFLAQFKRAYLNNYDENIRFNITLKTEPYYPDPESGFVSDIIEIFYRHPENTTSSSRVFVETVNQRSSLSVITPQNLGDLTILGKTFKDVRMNEFSNPRSYVMFNDEFGMISFTDEEGIRWRFDRYE